MCDFEGGFIFSRQSSFIKKYNIAVWCVCRKILLPVYGSFKLGFDFNISGICGALIAKWVKYGEALIRLVFQCVIFGFHLFRHNVEAKQNCYFEVLTDRKS